MKASFQALWQQWIPIDFQFLLFQTVWQSSNKLLMIYQIHVFEGVPVPSYFPFGGSAILPHLVLEQKNLERINPRRLATKAGVVAVVVRQQSVLFRLVQIAQFLFHFPFPLWGKPCVAKFVELNERGKCHYQQK